VFAIKGNECFTHPANHFILNGITRQVVIRLLSSANLIFREISFTPEELYEMDEAFLTSTGHEVCPIVEIDGQKIGNGMPGTYTRRLQSEFNKLLLNHLDRKKTSHI
jgi:D-alanine transaminase